jgi:MoxR-like ATPase
MNFTELSKLIHALPLAQTALLLGKPGIGKTALGRDVARLMTEARRKDEPSAPEAVCHVVDLSSSLPEDISGLPFPQGDVTEYKPTAWVHDLCRPDAYGVLILDDLPAATQAVQVACRQIALERRVHRFAFAPGVRVIVTGNRREDKSASTTLPAHFRNSCVMLPVEPDIEEWCRWASDEQIPGVIQAYLRFRPAKLAMVPKDADEQGAFATPRTWAMLGRCYNAASTHDAVLDVAAGLVGQGVAIEFTAFQKLRHELPDPKLILSDPHRYMPTPPSEPDRLIAVATALAEYTAKEVAGSRGANRQDTLVRFLVALAHVTRNNREYCSMAVSTFTAMKGNLHELGGAALIAKKSSADVEALIRFLTKAVR